MKKSLLTAIAAILLFVMPTAAGQVDPADIINQVIEKTDSIDLWSNDIAAFFDMDIETSGMTLGMEIEASGKVTTQRDVISSSHLDIRATIMGEEQKSSSDSYTVFSEDGTSQIYSNDGGGWTVTQEPAGLHEEAELFSGIDPGKATVEYDEDNNIYVLTFTADPSEAGVTSFIGSLAGETDSAALLEATAYIEGESMLPAFMIMNSLTPFSASGEDGTAVTVNSLTMSVYYSFDFVEAPQLPEEALSARPGEDGAEKVTEEYTERETETKAGVSPAIDDDREIDTEGRTDNETETGIESAAENETKEQEISQTVNETGRGAELHSDRWGKTVRVTPCGNIDSFNVEDTDYYKGVYAYASDVNAVVPGISVVLYDDEELVEGGVKAALEKERTEKLDRYEGIEDFADETVSELMEFDGTYGPVLYFSGSFRDKDTNMMMLEYLAAVKVTENGYILVEMDTCAQTPEACREILNEEVLSDFINNHIEIF